MNKLDREISAVIDDAGSQGQVIVTLKDDHNLPQTRWLVIKLYDKVHDAKDFDWHRKWDNNI